MIVSLRIAVSGMSLGIDMGISSSDLSNPPTLAASGGNGKTSKSLKLAWRAAVARCADHVLFPLKLERFAF
jgi:hypothetical protein